MQCLTLSIYVFN